MIKILSAFCLLNFSNLLFAQEFSWNKDRKLSWQDFQGDKTDNKTSVAAFAYTGFSYHVNRSQDPNGKITILLINLFDPAKSWKKNNNLGNYLLLHEQLHFDITEIYTRQFRQLINQKIKKSEDFEKIFLPEYQRIYQEYQDFQYQYDHDTEHALNHEKQEKYTLIIQEKLNQLTEYQSK